ncbi:MAG: hypothetical protein ACKV2Q_00860 [Planctomycetaceae bacterium]
MSDDGLSSGVAHFINHINPITGHNGHSANIGSQVFVTDKTLWKSDMMWPPE